MTKITKSVFLENPIEAVFQYASDYTKWEDWFEGVSAFKPVTESNRGNGTRYAYKANMMGLTIGVEPEIFDFVENKGWKGKATKGMPHQTSWEFEAIDRGTKFTYGLEYEMPIPIIGKWIDNAFMKPQWEKIIERSLENLKSKMNDLK